MSRRIGLCALPVAFLLLATACPGDGNVTTDDGGTCSTSQQTHIWLLPFGPVSQEVYHEGKANLTVVVTRASETEGEGTALQGHAVTFKVITPGSDATLTAATINTGVDGLAQTTLQAGKQTMVLQVEASAEQTCPITFSVDVRQSLRQLMAITPSPYDTFTSSRVPIVVEASTDGNAKLPSEEIDFAIKLGKGGGTLKTVDNTSEGETLKVNTNDAGRATVMLETGSQATPQLVVEATMSGTAPVQIMMRVAKGQDAGCKDDSGCPLAYTCVNGKCESPPTTPPTGCTSDADCAPPTICQTTTGQCLEPTGNNCDPVEGTGCAPDEVCVGAKCAKVPSGCTDNSVCPPGWLCQAGTCIPGGQPPTGGCTTNKDCPANNTCINGQCKPKSTCNIQHDADRLKGTWQYDSTLHLRDSLSGVLKALLSTSGVLRDIIEGTFSISGIPSFISSIVKKYLKQLIDQYVPPWGQQLIIALGDINDIVDDMRVLSTVQTTSVGNDSYVNSEQWDLVEFDYKGQKISSPPAAIPQIGQVKVPTYSSHEVCGVLFIDKHQVNNVVGGLIQWAINTALSVVTCSVNSVPCYGSVDQALQQSINCQMLGMQLDQVVKSIWSGAPSVAMIVIQACENEKQKLIQLLNQELAGLTTKLSLLELSGTVNIPNPPGDNVLSGGQWTGVLGTGIAKGSFKGDFKANRP